MDPEHDEREGGSQGGRGLWKLGLHRDELQRDLVLLSDVPRVLSERRARRLLSLHTVEVMP